MESFLVSYYRTCFTMLHLLTAIISKVVKGCRLALFSATDSINTSHAGVNEWGVNTRCLILPG